MGGVDAIVAWSALKGGMRYIRGIKLPKDETSSDAADSAETDHGGAAESALPLAADVVGLVGHHGGHIGIGSCGHEEHTEVPHGRGGVPAHDGQADDAEQGVEGDDGSANVVFVSYPASCEHHHAGKRVRRCHQALGGSDRETHVVHQDDWEEVCKGVCDGGGVKEAQCVGPNLSG